MIRTFSMKATRSLRRSAFVTAWIFAIVWVACVPAKGNDAAEPKPFAITHGPYLQAPSETGITISWATSAKSVSWLEYRAESATAWQTNVPSRHGLVNADVTHHNVTLSDLKPGTAYVYRTVSREILDFQAYRVKFGETVVSQETRFTTLHSRKPGFSFVVVQDRHEKVDLLRSSWASVDWAGVDLVFLNGDMVHWVKDPQQLYKLVVDPCVESFASRTPFVYIRGNHDGRGSFARHLLDYFPTDSGRFFYTLRHGPVIFIVLDCGEDKGDDSSEYSGLVAFRPYMEQQVKWLAQEIEKPEFRAAPFRVCLIHIPPADLDNQKFIQPRWLWQNVVPLLNKGKVDLIISGHTHRDTVRLAGEGGMNFPGVIGGPETVLRFDVSQNEIRLTNKDLAGNALPQLPPVKARSR
jgi:acid phosphatase type 7